MVHYTVHTIVHYTVYTIVYYRVRCPNSSNAPVRPRVALHARHEGVDHRSLERVAAAAAAARPEAPPPVGVEAVGFVDHKHATLRPAVGMQRTAAVG